MSLKNIKKYVQAVRQNNGILDIDQIQIETRAAVPTDANLANGRLVYITGTGFRGYAEGAWFTIPTSTTGGSGSSWDSLYSSDKSVTIDGASLTFAGVHATNDVITISNSGTGSTLQLTNTSTGADITGTSATWSVSAAGAAVFTQVTGCDVLTAATNLAINATGAGTIAIGNVSSGAVTITPALTATASITITGSADATCLTVTAGDVTVTQGLLSLDDDDTATGNLTIPSSAATSGNVINVVANALTSGAGIKISTTNGANFSGDGGYIHLSDGTNPQFTVKRYGATVIAGNAATDMLTITAGHAVITSGNLTLSSGNLVMTSGSFTYTAGDMAMSDGSLTITDADNAATLSVTNSTATSESPFVFVGAGAFTGSTTKSWMTLTAAGLTTGTQVYAAAAAITEGKIIHLTAGASLTSGSMLYVQDTGANSAITSGTLATFDLTSTAITGTVNKIGAGVSVASSRTTTTGTVADDFDLVSIVRTDIGNISGGGTFSATGSVLYVENAVTNTAGTVTDTTNGIEVVMDSLGTGVGVKVTHAAVGANAISVISAATTVSDVLITGSGVKANNKASLEVTNSGATAAGGSIFRVTNTGTPAAATSYLVDFDYSGATMTNNPTTIYIHGKDSTNSTVEINSSGASAANKGMLSLLNSNTGVTGVVVHTQHTSTGSAAANDAVFTLIMEGLDAGDAVTEYARLEGEIMNATAGQEDGRFVFSAAANDGTLTQMATLNPRAGGALAELVMGSGAANAYITTSGAYDLVIDTNQGTNSGSITIADGVNGDITIVPGSTAGQIQLTSPSYGQVTAGADGNATLTIAMSGIYTIGNTVARTLTLPAVAGTAGLWYTIKKTSVNAAAVTIDTPGGETIDGAATNVEVDAQYDVITIVSDGTNWHVVNKMIAA